MKKIFVALSMVAFLAACDDSSSASAENNEPAALSSAEELGSSSSVKSGSDEPNLSSSFEKKTESSSSEKLFEISSDSVDDMNCSALLEQERKNKKWSWDVPKECRFNPRTAYGTMTDSRDKKVYKIVKIGSQVWMAENLNYADSAKTPSLLKRSWCYNNRAENCDVAGRLYTWAAAIDSIALYDGGNGVDCGYGKTCSLPTKVRGICPDGWHLPDSTEWNTLFVEVGERSTAGNVLKSQTGWTNYGNGTDAVGVSALPAGYRTYYDDDFSGDGNSAYFWNTAQYNDYWAGFMTLYYYYDDAYLLYDGKNNGMSVRCVKD